MLARVLRGFWLTRAGSPKHGLSPARDKRMLCRQQTLPGAARKRGPMQHPYQPIIHKARLHGLAVNVGRTGLSLNDAAELQQNEQGIGVHAMLQRPFLGLIPRQKRIYLGQLGPAASALVAPHLDRGGPLRVRIVGLTPEHLAGTDGPEVHVSVWGVLDTVIPPAPPLTQPERNA